MPAIQLARLKIQSAELVSRFIDPTGFIRNLHELMDFYADRTRKPGQSRVPTALIKSYNVPRPVLRQIRIDLGPYVAENPEAALDLCDALWLEPYFEFRLLVADLLGMVPGDHQEQILERVTSWAVPGTEDRLLNALLGEGLTQVRKETPQRFSEQLEEWLAAEKNFSRRIGLKAMSISLANGDFENYPRLFRLLAPLVREVPIALRPDLLDVIQALAERSPHETAFFLRSNLSLMVDEAGPAWLIRNSVRYFPEDLQISLKSALHETT